LNAYLAEIGIVEGEFAVGWSDEQWKSADTEMLVRDVNCMRRGRLLTEEEIAEAVRRMQNS
jgi:hypothetical protein